MKQVVCLTAEELRDCGVLAVTRRPEFMTRYVADAAYLLDPSNADERMRVRLEVVLFDTEKAVLAYRSGEDLIVDEKPAANAAPTGEKKDG